MSLSSPTKTKSKVKIGGGIGNISTFLGKRPPQEIKNFVDLYSKLSGPILKKICLFVCEYLKHTEISSEQWQKLVNTASKEIDETEARLTLAAVLLLFKTALRERIEPGPFQEALESLTLGGDKQNILVASYKQLKSTIIPKTSSNVSLPHISSMSWRVDITIATNEIDRVLKPTILMRIIDSNGDVKQMEMNPETFHQLRYSVARVIKEIESLDSMQILKIDKTS